MSWTIERLSGPRPLLYLLVWIGDCSLSLFIFTVTRHLAEQEGNLVTLGIFGSALSVTVALCAALFGHVSDRLGRRRSAPRGAREPGGMQGPTNGLSQQPVAAGGSLTLGAQGKVEAASTTTEWSGTSRHSTSTRHLAEQEGNLVTLGIFGSALSVTVALCAALFGHVSDRLGRRRMIAAGSVLMGASYGLAYPWLSKSKCMRSTVLMRPSSDHR